MSKQGKTFLYSFKNSINRCLDIICSLDEDGKFFVLKKQKKKKIKLQINIKAFCPSIYQVYPLFGIFKTKYFLRFKMYEHY